VINIDAETSTKNQHHPICPRRTAGEDLYNDQIGIPQKAAKAIAEIGDVIREKSKLTNSSAQYCSS
jgi:hypothetical protein